MNLEEKLIKKWNDYLEKNVFSEELRMVHLMESGKDLSGFKVKKIRPGSFQPEWRCFFTIAITIGNDEEEYELHHMLGDEYKVALFYPGDFLSIDSGEDGLELEMTDDEAFWLTEIFNVNRESYWGEKKDGFDKELFASKKELIEWRKEWVLNNIPRGEELEKTFPGLSKIEVPDSWEMDEWAQLKFINGMELPVRIVDVFEKCKNVEIATF